MQNIRKKPLTNLEYCGLENLLHRIITTYEDFLGISNEDQTPIVETTRWTDNSIEIFNGEYDLYIIEGFAIKNLFVIDNQCVMSGFYTNGKEIEDFCNNTPDTLIDLTEFLNGQYIDIDLLIKKIKDAR